MSAADGDKNLFVEYELWNKMIFMLNKEISTRKIAIYLEPDEKYIFIFTICSIPTEIVTDAKFAGNLNEIDYREILLFGCCIH